MAVREASTTLVALIQKCISASNALRKARQIHAAVLTTTLPSSPPFLNNNLLSLYAKCGSLVDAKLVFDTMPRRDIVSYNAIISACSRTPHDAVDALKLYLEMSSLGIRPNCSTLSSLLQASSSLMDQSFGAVIHSKVFSCGFYEDVCAQTALIGMYSGCGDIESANQIFYDIVERDVVAWNSIISGNVSNFCVKRGMQLFRTMIMSGSVPTNFTFSIVLNACSRLGDLQSGKIIHGQIIKSDSPVDVPLQNALLDMYASCRDVETALSVFREIETPDLVSWNSMIAGYSVSEDGVRAMFLFTQLQTMSSKGPEPDEYTFAAIVSATAPLPATNYGKPLHAQVKKSGLEGNIYVGSTLIEMYFKNQEPDSACKLFNEISEKDIKVWTTMIAGHSRLGEGETAIRFFYKMQEEGLRVDSFALSSALNSTADLASLRQGELIHSQVVKIGCEADASVSGGLIDMYAKNGDLGAASSIFYRIAIPDLKCWNSMIGGYGQHGNAIVTFELFDEMLKQGLEPDYVTFVSLLSACSHCGMVERGRFFWNYMTENGIIPGPKHYACMVSLYGRAGLLQEAEDLIIESPFVHSFPELWRIVLSSCVVLRDLDVGIHAAEQILMSEPNDISTHILLSNLFASVGRWDFVAEMRRKIRGLMLEKDRGLSWTEIKSKVHVFSADDDSHPWIDDARAVLDGLKENLKGWETREYIPL